MGIEDTPDTSFICEVCKETTDTIYMGRVENVCEYCEAKGDVPHR